MNPSLDPSPPLDRIADALERIADHLDGGVVQPAPAPPAAPKAKGATRDNVARALKALTDDGRGAVVDIALQALGARTVADVPDDRLPDLTCALMPEINRYRTRQNRRAKAKAREAKS
ncbi:hypothetical protein [Ruania rhizosphaerae]|uniref:hypothetical protein n=1 Tax=Ruania rhizosphaerae TaxID=1840413 RepID=UPI001359F374|nr:hypothetical protein [Ruania rhizosphaerae]